MPFEIEKPINIQTPRILAFRATHESKHKLSGCIAGCIKKKIMQLLLHQQSGEDNNCVNSQYNLFNGKKVSKNQLSF